MGLSCAAGRAYAGSPIFFTRQGEADVDPHRAQTRRARHPELVARYGERLASVRYCYDPTRGKRYKTVELIVAEEDWRPPAEPKTEAAAPAPKPRATPRVPVRIQYFEKDLQRRIRAAGGLWDPRRKLWYAPEEYVKRLGLANRIVR